MARLAKLVHRLGGAFRRPAAPVVVVSGPPRAGTSLAMQMLEAGGISPMTDGVRAPDAGNPRGYYELEAVKRLPRDAGWVAGAAGRAVKVVHVLVAQLPTGPRYRVLWLERDLGEVARSQRRLLERLGRAPDDGLSDARVAELLGRQLAEAARALDARDDVARLVVPHAGLLADPHAQAARIAHFLGGELDVAAMASVVDPALHRVHGDA